MKLYVLFHHYEDDPSLMPNAIAVADEYTLETMSPKDWTEEKDQAKGRFGPGSTREAIIHVPDAAVLALFKTTEIRAEMVEKP